MARAAKLKVYRTPIGFHDAYVAAPSQKAALAAWGSDADLFARGIAERIDDPELAREPLEKPGTVVKRSRGTTAEQLAALPPDRPSRPISKPKADPAQPRPTRPRPEPKPKPRAELDAAEAAITEADQAYSERRAHLIKEEKRLVQERRKLDDRYAAERDRLEDRRRRAEADHARALKEWRG